MGSRTRISRFVTPPANLPGIQHTMGKTAKLNQETCRRPLIDRSHQHHLRYAAVLPRTASSATLKIADTQSCRWQS